MSPAEALLDRARDYELLAAWHADRGPVSAESATSAVGFILAAIVLREVAEALSETEERWAA